MAVLGRLLISSAERLDLPDILSLDSYDAGDWTYFMQGLVGQTTPYILRGFDVNDPDAAIGSQSCSINVADSSVFYPSSTAGAFYFGLPQGNPNAAPLVPELIQNAANFIYLTLTTTNTSEDTRAFWDPDANSGAGGEFTQDVNTETVLSAQIGVSTGAFPVNTVPLAIITVGPTVITSIQDCRPMLFRLGSGGINPDPFHRYDFRGLPSNAYERAEPPTTLTTSSGPNPFQGADKNIESMKEWMDVVMTKLAELGGTTFWYQDASTFSLINLFTDALATTFRSKGLWTHSSATPGLLTWTEDVVIESTLDPRQTILRAGNVTLANGQVAFINQQRNLNFNTLNQPVAWTNGASYVNTIGGAVGLFANVVQGDYVKAQGDPNQYYLRVEQFYANLNASGATTTPALAKSILLSGPYLGISQNAVGVDQQGVYLSSAVQVVNKGDPSIIAAGGNALWLAIREDQIQNIGSVTSTSLALTINQITATNANVVSGSAHGLVSGDQITISGSTNFNGTFVVEVDSATAFHINGTFNATWAPDSGTGTYAIVVTAARDNGHGLQLENADNNFNTGDTVIIAGTTNYNGSYSVSSRNSTTFQIAISASHASETIGTATLAVLIVRDEEALVKIIQGESIDVGGEVIDNLRKFVGMQSVSQSVPNYEIPGVFGGIQGYEDYYSSLTDSLTDRVSRLTGMMADKAQDKTIIFAPEGYDTITNTTSGGNQVVTFSSTTGGTPLLNFIMPGSPANGSLALGSPFSITLAANQAAYISVNRNAAFVNPAVTVVAIAKVPLDENIYILAARLGDNNVWIWDGTRLGVGSTPIPPQLETIINQNKNSKLIEGGNWSYVGSGTGPAEIAEQTSDNNDLYVTAGTGGAAFTGQTFTPTIAGNISSVQSFLKYATVPLSGLMTLKLYTDNLGSPGTLLGTSQTFDSSTLTNSYQEVVFNFTSAVAVSASTVYHMVFDTTSVINGEILSQGISPNTYVGGNVEVSTDGGATWTQNPTLCLYFIVESAGTGTGTLTWDANAYIQIPGLTDARNTILPGSVSLPLSDYVAYVEINRTPGASANLTVQTASIQNVPLDDYTVIIARKLIDVSGNYCIVGTSSDKLYSGQSQQVDSKMSNNTQTLLGGSAVPINSATSSAAWAARQIALGAVDIRNNPSAPLRTIDAADSAFDAQARMDIEINKLFGQMRIIPRAGFPSQVQITAADQVMQDGSILSQEVNNVLLAFSGAVIDFSTGSIYEPDGVTPLPGGTNFTPFSLIPGDYVWYGITLSADTVSSLNAYSVSITVTAATGANPTQNLAKFPTLPSGDKPSGAVQVFNNAGTIEEVAIRNLGIGAGGGGAGGTALLSPKARAVTSSNGSTELYNCETPTNVGGKTQIQLDFNIDPGDFVTVFVGEKAFPQFINLATTPGPYWVQLAQSLIGLDTDYISGPNQLIEIKTFSNAPPVPTPSLIAGLDLKDRAFGRTDGSGIGTITSDVSAVSAPVLGTATATLGVNTFTAVNPGPYGNDISLVFNGSTAVSAVVTAWNAANPLNQVGFTGADNTPTAQTVNLTGGNYVVTITTTFGDMLPTDVIFVEVDGIYFPQYISDAVTPGPWFKWVSGNQVSISDNSVDAPGKEFDIRVYQGQSLVDQYGNVTIPLKGTGDTIILQSPNMLKWQLGVTTLGELTTSTVSSGVVTPVLLARDLDNDMTFNNEGGHVDGLGVLNDGTLVVDNAPVGGVEFTSIHLVDSNSMVWRLGIELSDTLYTADGFGNTFSITDDEGDVYFQVNESVGGAIINTRYYSDSSLLPNPPSLVNGTVPTAFAYNAAQNQILEYIYNNGAWETLVPAPPAPPAPAQVAAVPLGTVFDSMLTQAEMTSVYGNQYVIADGSSCIGSLYNTLLGFTAVPDLRGVFRRAKNNGRVDGNQNPDGEVPLGTIQVDAFEDHSHSIYRLAAASGAFSIMSSFNDGQGLASTNGANSGNVAGETRPRNVTVNTFIRIN